MTGEAQRLSPGQAGARPACGRVPGVQGTPADAEACEQAVAAASGSAALSTNLGILCAKLNRVVDAEHWLRRAIQLDPGLKEAHASLGALYAGTGRLELAEALCKHALALDPDFAIAHRNLAVLAASRGDREAERRHWRAVLAQQSVFPEPSSEPGRTRTVLVPLAGGGGNVPIRHILPASRNALVKWCVGHARPGDGDALPEYNVIFNAIGDPDEGAAAAAALSILLAGCGRSVLNAPDRVAATRRDRLPALLGPLPGVAVPPVVRVGESDLPAEAAQRAGLRCPALIRPAGSHGGDGVVLLETEDALAGLRPGGERYVTAFRDYRSPDGLWRKYRAIFVGGALLPYHLAISDQWLVHYRTAGMAGSAARRDEERRFLRDPAAELGAATWGAVREIGRRIGLDWCGIDFARLDDGRVLVFEANATMNVHPEPNEGVLAYKNPAVYAIVDAFEVMLARAAGPPPS